MGMEMISYVITEDLLQEAERLKVSLQLDLEVVVAQSKIKFYSIPTSVANSSDKCSIHFIPMSDDDRDEFIDLLADELTLRRMSPTGDSEELRQRLLEEMLLEVKLHCHRISYRTA